MLQNYGVTFTMLSPAHVKVLVDPMFAEVGKQSEEPSWNFYIWSARRGQVLNHWGSRKTLHQRPLRGMATIRVKNCHCSRNLLF